MRYLTKHMTEQRNRGICLDKALTGCKGNRKVGLTLKTILLLAGLLLLLIFGCPIYQLWNVPCPCCGVTRAWIAFLQGNIASAFQYHMLFPVIPLLIPLYICHDLLPTQWRKYADTVTLVLGTAVFIYALLRWLGFVDMP